MTEINLILQYLSINEILVIQMIKDKNSSLSDYDFYELLKKDYPKIYEKIEKMRNDIYKGS